ncbi:MAG: hypothetical protein ACXADX_04770 [Candidatus Hodarchaeales archaeon]
MNNDQKRLVIRAGNVFDSHLGVITEDQAIVICDNRPGRMVLHFFQEGAPQALETTLLCRNTSVEYSPRRLQWSGIAKNRGLFLKPSEMPEHSPQPSQKSQVARSILQKTVKITRRKRLWENVAEKPRSHSGDRPTERAIFGEKEALKKVPSEPR